MFEQSVATTTLEEIQGSANVSSSQLYHYFENKDDLVQAVIEEQANKIVENQERAQLDGPQGFRAWREVVVGVKRELNGRGGCPLGSLGSELAETDPRGRSEVAAGFRRWAAVIGGDLRAMYDRGELVAEADPDQLALATLATLQGGLLLGQIERSTKPLEAALDAMVTLIDSLSPRARA